MHLVAADWAVTAFFPPTEVYVVNGFARSGTTWLQQNLARAIGAKTIFEPFAENYPGYQRRLKALRAEGADGRDLPYLDRPENMVRIKPYLDSIFRGYVDHAFGLQARDSWRDSLRRKLVVKFVRASLSLEGIHAFYGFPVIHIRRHPCAVVASLRSVENWGWSFDDVSIQDILLAPADGRAEIFDAHRDVIARCDREGSDAKIATYWALTERYVEETLANASWARSVRYEDLAANPEREFAAILDFLGCEFDQVPDFNASSVVTAKKRQTVPMQQRVEDWRTRLSTAEIGAIMAVVSELFPAFRES